MKKIISINEIKNSKNENSNDIDSIIDKIYNLVEDEETEEAFKISKKLYSEDNTSEDICRTFIYTVASNCEDMLYEELKESYFTIKEIFEKFSHQEYIVYYYLLFCVLKNKEVNSFETNFDNEKIFKKYYLEFNDSENIAYIYAVSLLLNIELYSEDDLITQEIFDKTVSQYMELIINTEDNESIAVEYAKFLYFSAEKYSNKKLINQVRKLILNLIKDFEDNEEILILYCTFITRFHTISSDIESIKIIKELNRIIEKNDNVIFKQILFMAFHEAGNLKTYDETKFIIKHMLSIIRSLEKDSVLQTFYINLLAENLSNYSCEDNITASKINNELLQYIKDLMNEFGYTENLINEYCIILYNLSCLMSFYEDNDAPYIDVIKELENCSDNFDVAVPYYCLSISNLIHLCTVAEGIDIVKNMKKMLLEFEEDEMPSTKDGISLTDIYAIALANLINEIENYEDCLEYISEIKNLISDKKNDDLSIDLDITYSKDSINIFKQYCRALRYLLSKKNINNKQYERIYNIEKEISLYIKEREI